MAILILLPNSKCLAAISHCRIPPYSKLTTFLSHPLGPQLKLMILFCGSMEAQGVLVYLDSHNKSAQISFIQDLKTLLNISILFHGIKRPIFFSWNPHQVLDSLSTKILIILLTMSQLHKLMSKLLELGSKNSQNFKPTIFGWQENLIAECISPFLPAH